MSTDREKIAKRRQRRRRRRLKTSVKIGIALFVALIAGGSFAYYDHYQKLNAPDPNGKLSEIQKQESNKFNLTEEVMPDAYYMVINAGDGEAIFIKTGDTDILIDTGKDAKAKAIIETVQKELTGELDYLFITSTSERRIGGFREVIINLKPKQIYTCELGDELNRPLHLMAERTPMKVIGEGPISLGDSASLTIFKPEVSSKDPFDRSLMTLFRYGDTTFFAESDAGVEEESRAIEKVGKCNVAVLARGGSDEVNQRISELNPELYVVSTSKKKLPSDGLIDALGSRTYATFISGTIKFTTNGKELTSNLEKDSSIVSYLNAEAKKAEEEAKKKAEEESKDEG